MATIVTRAGKGSPLTNNEVDDNFVNLNTELGTLGAIQNIFYENGKIVTTDYTIPNTKNVVSAGPITIADGVTVTIDDGGEWTIV